jgi:hypothetical protein
MASSVLSLPENSLPARNFLLKDEIPALPLLATENGNSRWGPLIRLPRGAELQDFGAGFDERTLRVRFNGGFYIIFRQDLDSQRPAARAKTAGNE